MNVDPNTTKYTIKARIIAEGVVEKPDVIGAIFGQTEGLLGEELDLRDLQKSGRIGRIEVEILSEKGKSVGDIIIPSSMDQVETAILASALETIDRVGPCKAKIDIDKIEDVRIAKKEKIVERAKELLGRLIEDGKVVGTNLIDTVRESVQAQEIVSYGEEHLPAGPNIESSDAIIVVEGRADVLTLLKCGIKNVIAVEGTNIPKTIREISKEKVTTAFVDGDRGGDLVLKELLQVGEIDFVARAPRGKEVEELTQKQIMKALRSKMPVEQFIETFGSVYGTLKPPEEEQVEESKTEGPKKYGIISSFMHRARQDKGKKQLSNGQRRYRQMLLSLTGSSKANLLNEKGNVVKEMPTKDLSEELKSATSVSAVVFDGIITQRLLDIAYEKNIKTIVGIKCGNITKQPMNIEVLTKEDLE
ncbi:MAG: DNA primase DnaG [Candidatus Thermoplasmatota archaeon]